MVDGAKNKLKNNYKEEYKIYTDKTQYNEKKIYISMKCKNYGSQDSIQQPNYYNTKCV